MPTPHALFPPWTNGVLLAGLAALGVLMVAIPAVLVFAMRQPPVTGAGRIFEQPVPFDHRHHIRDLGIDCRYCHEGVEHEAHAGVPPADRCMNCHNQVWAQAAILSAVRVAAASGEPIHWRRVHTLPDFVYFDHSVHVQRGIGCSSCHGRIDGMAHVYQVAPLTMGWCIDCHRHPELALRPATRITDEEWAPTPAEQRRLGTDLRDQLAIAPTLDCSGCHR